MILNFRLFFIVATTFLMSCGGSKEELIIPENIIGKDKFSSIMVDVLILEGYKSRALSKKDSIDYVMQSYYQDLYRKYEVDKEIYDRSYLFYSENPVLMQEIFALAETKFKLKEDEVSSERKKKTTPADSTSKKTELIFRKN
ncbi:MAG: hypothetical protein ACI8XB_000154 [Patiriisocius sp.]|jgi:hypothetical protein